jgi:hypothetical protein
MNSKISHPTHTTSYAPFTPSKSEQRLPPLYYRGCWHRVSRGFLVRYYQSDVVLAHHRLLPDNRSLQSEDLHPPRGVAGSRFRACPRFSTAASRRSLGSVSVPVWPITLSGRLPVSLGEPLPHQLADRTWAHLKATGLATRFWIHLHAETHHIRY